MEKLLETASRKNMHSQFTRQLLTAFSGIPAKLQAEKDAQQQNLKLVEPLTRREIEVLRLITEGLSNKEIAQKLDISLRTVKFYGTSIYSKLGISGRTQAIRKAKELGLV